MSRQRQNGLMLAHIRDPRVAHARVKCDIFIPSGDMIINFGSIFLSMQSSPKRRQRHDDNRIF